MNQWKNYIVHIVDPRTGNTQTYPFMRAVSEAHADRQARDAYMGLLGVDQDAYEALELDIQEVPQG